MEVEIKQFKLASGEEVIARVIAWPDEDKDDGQIIISQPLKMIPIQGAALGSMMYVMRPWLVLQDRPNQWQVLFFDQVVGMAIPAVRMVDQYNLSLAMSNQSDSDEEAEAVEIAETEFKPLDSDHANVFVFPGGRTKH